MAGGLERNIIYLANRLVEEGHTARLVTFDLPGAESFFDVDPRVDWLKVGRSQPHRKLRFRTAIGTLRRLRSAIASPPADAVICFTHGVLFRTFVAAAGLGTHVVCSERNSLSMYRYTRSRKLSKNWILLYLVKAITVQFPSYRKDYPARLQSKIHIVPNPIFPASDEHVPREPIILSLGRLSTQKRFDWLIAAAELAFDHHPEWRLIIAGSGEHEQNLRSQAASSRHAARIELRAATRDVQSLLRRASVYAQPSQWEGFPNALAEAMAAGVVPVGFRDTAGVSDLIQDGENGFLAQGAPSIESLAETLRTAMEADRSEMSKRAAGVAAQYSPDVWFTAWRRVLAI